MKNNDVWDLIPLPKDAKHITCKWIFKINKDSKSNMERYKDFTQKECIDYKKTFFQFLRKAHLGS